MSQELLTTREAARIAGVGASSVKRWADLNLLRCVRTAGGHRRFHREDLDAFMREHGEVLGGAAADWVDLFLERGVFEIQGELLRARDRLGAWHGVADELGAALGELGARWARGELTVIEEHVASEKLSRGIERVVETIPSTDADPRCLLAMAEHDEHTLGLSLVELCLKETGWSSMWCGRSTPLKELLDHAQNGSVKMVALSASAASSDPRRLAGEAARVGAACRKGGVILVLGGAGAWPDQPPYGTRVRDLQTLHQLATAWRLAATRSPG